MVEAKSTPTDDHLDCQEEEKSGYCRWYQCYEDAGAELIRVVQHRLEEWQVVGDRRCSGDNEASYRNDCITKSKLVPM